MMQSRIVAWVGILGLIGATSGSAQLSEAAGIRTIVPFEVGRFDLNLGGTVHRLGSPIGVRAPYMLQSTLRLPLRASGFWAGVGIESAGYDTVPTSPVFSYGVWRSHNRIQVSVGATTHRIRRSGYVTKPRLVQNPPVAGADTGTWTMRADTVRPDVARWQDIESRVAWRVNTITMEAVLGARPAVDKFAAAVWGRVGALYPISSRLSLVGTLGAEPARMSIGLPATSVASLALRVRAWRAPPARADATAPTAFVVQRADSGTYRVVYAIQNAKTVELSGDFANWMPVTLSQTRSGLWEATLVLKPGTYHVNVRVNGGRWLPPPGLPQADDDFNGAVGVLVVR
jgi:hypothetical protein